MRVALGGHSIHDVTDRDRLDEQSESGIIERPQQVVLWIAAELGGKVAAGIENVPAVTLAEPRAKRARSTAGATTNTNTAAISGPIAEHDISAVSASAEERTKEWEWRR